ncbi:hypothetical protein HY933_02400 [Candidatus Falkowbacteria bacterium]|nr:hypothetical protein [Candidatus Falkowbacteria bacterium]
MHIKSNFLKIKQFFQTDDRRIYLEFAIVSLFIFWPLLIRGGYVFAIDMVFVPQIRFPREIDPYTILHFFMWLVNWVIPSTIVQKIMLCLVPFLSGVGMYRLIPTESRWPRYFAAFFYIFNPFTYSRFLYGHLLILLSYALIPFAVRAIIDFFSAPTRRSALRVVGWLVLITLIDFRTIFFVLLFFAVYWLCTEITLLMRDGRSACRRDSQFVRLILWSVVVAVVFVLLNSFWLIPAFFGQNSLVSWVKTQISDQNFDVFTTVSDANVGVYWNTAAMYGFWGDRERQYVVQKEVIPYWFWVFLALFALVLWGLVSTLFLRRRWKLYPNDQPATGPPLLLTLTIVALFSWVFVVGFASPYTRIVVSWLYSHILYLRGYREPQKFIALIVLAYAYLGALGFNNIIVLLKQSAFIKKNKQVYPSIVFLIVILPLLYSPALFSAFGNQLYLSWYPAGWYEVNNILNDDPDDFRTLFLPWHQYLEFAFSGKIIANPAEDFFDQPVIAGDNIEIGQIYSQSTRPESRVIEENIVLRQDKSERLIETLNQLNFKYVILATGGTFWAYDSLDTTAGLAEVYRSPDIVLYRNITWRPAAIH